MRNVGFFAYFCRKETVAERAATDAGNRFVGIVLARKDFGCRTGVRPASLRRPGRLREPRSGDMA